MARVYVGQFDNVAVSAAQDFFDILATTTIKQVRLLRCVLSATDTTIPTSQMVRVQIKVLQGATMTAPAGGTTPTAQKVDFGDPAATGFTLGANNTTQASTTGTTNIVYDGGFHVYNGFDESFFADGSNPRGAIPVFVNPAATAGNAVIAVATASTVTGTIHFSGTVWVEEVG